MSEPSPIQLDESKLDVTHIMRAIREQITQRQHAAETAGIDFGKLARGEYTLAQDGNFPDGVYEAAFQAGMLRDKTQVSPFVTARPIPIVGGLVARARGALHQLVLFYVNMSAQRQIAFNTEISKAVSQLVTALDAQFKTNQAALETLQEENARLRERIDALERHDGRS